ncbi:hypothetical protein [Ruminococcus sp.]|uniref:hypothetical protein n=1 Tax=Ruminococcus sp. TaxID=41978 RepID=UPI0039A31C7D
METIRLSTSSVSRGLAQDRIDEAEQLFIKSAEKGNVYSAFSLGRIYMTEESGMTAKLNSF